MRETDSPIETMRAVRFFLLVVAVYISFSSKAQDSIASPVVILIQSEQYDSAIVTLNQLILENPAKKELHYNRGLCYYNTSKYDSAILDFNAALAIDSVFQDALYLKGLSLAEKGDLERAITTMEFLVEQNKDYNNASKCIKKYRFAVFISRTWYYMIAMAVIVFILLALVTGFLSYKKN